MDDSCIYEKDMRLLDQKWWDKETFLQQVCNKAGLPSDAYKDKGANLYRFSAIVFSESDFE